MEGQCDVSMFLLILKNVSDLKLSVNTIMNCYLRE